MWWSVLAGAACARLLFFAPPPAPESVVAPPGEAPGLRAAGRPARGPAVLAWGAAPPAVPSGNGAAAGIALAAALVAYGVGQRGRPRCPPVSALALDGRARDPERSAVSRRALLRSAPLSAAALGLGTAPGGFGPRAARAMGENAAPAEVNLEDLPRGAASAYKQYWPALQLAADYYVFELRDFVMNPARWDLVNAYMESKSIGSAQSPSRLEREFIQPMRVLSLAFPPDLGGDEMIAALGGFQKAMGKLQRVQAVSAVEQMPDKTEVAKVFESWREGRVAVNAFFDALNGATQSTRLIGIPVDGKGYPRSKELYTQLKKDAALCRNRGGEQLAGIWGGLMVYGTVPGVNPCGNVNMATYFNQTAGAAAAARALQ